MVLGHRGGKATRSLSDRSANQPAWREHVSLGKGRLWCGNPDVQFAIFLYSSLHCELKKFLFSLCIWDVDLNMWSTRQRTHRKTSAHNQSQQKVQGFGRELN